MTVFVNGSPKKRFSVSSFLIKLISLFVRGKIVTEHVRNAGDHKRILNKLADADAVVFSLPLYVDGVPSHMLAFMKEMEEFCLNKKIFLKVYVVSNGGFIEGSQNYGLMQVYDNFCKRCHFQWCGGIGIGGGVMLNVMRVLFFAAVGLFLLITVTSGVAVAFPMFVQHLSTIFLLSLGVLFFCMRMGITINKRSVFGVKFTRILLPSFIFIIVADLFFIITSVFQGGIFKGWLKRKPY